MKMLKPFALALLALTVAVSASAQNQLNIAADSGSGTYKKMLGELVSVCPDLNIKEVPPGAIHGAVGNLQALVENRVHAAFLHSDVFQYNAGLDTAYNRYQILATFYPEPIHVITLKQTKTFRTVTKQVDEKTWGGLSSKKKDVQEQEPVEINSLSDANGFKVGAAGGGFVTARVLRGAEGASFSPTEYPSGGDVFKALESGEIAAAIFVGAAPLPNLDPGKINRANFKIVPVGDAIAGKLSQHYREAKINYPGMTNGPIKTLAPVALVMSRGYSTPAMIALQKRFRSCVAGQLPRLQDEYSPNWQDVKAGDEGIGNIKYLQLK